jgi:hypothetical protein
VIWSPILPKTVTKDTIRRELQHDLDTMRVQLGLLCLLLVSAATTSSFAFAANNRHPSFVRDLQRGGSRAAINVDSSSEGALDGSGDEVSDLKTSNESTEAKGSSLTPEVSYNMCLDGMLVSPSLVGLVLLTPHLKKYRQKRPLKVLFLSSDTGGGHRASAEALGKQVILSALLLFIVSYWLLFLTSYMASFFFNSLEANTNWWISGLITVVCHTGLL